MQLHLTAIHPMIAAQLLRTAKNLFPQLKQNGFAGLYGDTPNDVVANYLIKRWNGIETTAPRDARQATRHAYNARTEFPAKYRRTKIRRIIIKF